MGDASIPSDSACTVAGAPTESGSSVEWPLEKILLGVLAIFAIVLKRRRTAIVIAVLACFSTPRPTSAITCTWKGSGGTGGNSWNQTDKWTETGTGGNSSCPPGSNDNAIFNTGSVACTHTANITVNSFQMNSGYSGTFTQAAFSITTVADFTMGAGTFLGSAIKIVVGTDFNMSGGAFTSSSNRLEVNGAFNKTGGTFTHNNGEVMLRSGSNKTFASNGATFYDLIINDGMVGYWKLDETSGTTAVNSSGFYTNPAYSATAPTQTTTSLPSVNFADPAYLHFNGSSSYVSTSNFSPYEFAASESYTLSVWVKATNLTSASYQGVITFSRDTSPWWGLWISPGNTGSPRWFNGGPSQSATGAVVTAGWHHVVLVQKGSGAGNTSKVYVDGTDTTTGSFTAQDGSGGGTISFGRSALPGEYFTGDIDDVRVYDRALSTTEISALAAGNLPATGVATQTLTGNPIVANDLTIGSGTLAAGNTTITVAGSWWNYGGIFTTGTTGNVTFNGSTAGQIILAGGSAFNDLTISGTGAWAISDTGSVTMGGDLIQSAGTVTSTSGLLNIQGAFNKTGGTFTHNSGQVMLSSTSNQTFATNGATFNNLTINDGLIGYWTLDETATPSADSSGYGLDATWNSSPSGSATIPTVNFTDSHSLSIDSASDYASFASPAASVITVAAWVKATAAGGGTYQRILELPGYVIFWNAAGLVAPDNPMSLAITSNRTTTGGEWKSPSNSLTYGAWYHVAITYDSSSTANDPVLYINGVSKTVTEKTAPSGTQLSNVGTGYIGNRAAADRYFNGLIDDLRIYNRALTAPEIYSLYIGNQAGTGLATQTLTGNPIIAGDLVIGSGTLAAGTTSIQVAGNWSNYGGLFTAGSTGLVTFNGSSGSHTIRSAGQMFGGITINGSGNTWTLGGRLDMNPASTLTVTAGTLDLSSYTLRTGNIDKTAAVALTPSTGTVVLDGNTSATTDQGTFYNLRVEPVAATNLVGYWKLDAGQGLTAKDFSSGAHDGTLTNGPLWTNSGLSSTIQFYNPAAVSFDGTNDYIDIGAAATPTNASFSACAWVNLTVASSNESLVTIDGTHRSAFFLKRDASTKFSMQMYSTDATSGGTSFFATGTTVPAAGTWYHVCGTYDGTNERLYVNGGLEATTAVATVWNATGHTIIGASLWSDARSDYMNGVIDDVRIYNVALSLAQIAALAAGTYPTGLSGTPTYTLGANTTVTGTLSMDSGTLASSSYTMNASTAANVATVYSGTYSVGSTTNTFAGGLTVNKYGTLDLPTNGGVVQIGPTTATTKVLTIDGTLSGSGTTGGTIQKNSGANNYTFTVGSSATATPTLDITRLAVKNTDTNGMNINVNHGSVTTFTNFDNIAFSSGTGNYLLQIYSTSLALYGNGLTFDASTTSNLKLQGNGTGDGETRTYLGATCTNTPCESYDADDDSEPDGTGDTGALGDEAVAQWLHTAYDDTAGSIQGFPTTAFDWNTFAYWNTYVVYRDFSGSTDRLFARDTDGAFKNTAGGAGYYWDLPGSVGDITGVPRWTMESSTHYVYVVTTLGYVYKLSDSGTAFTLVTAQAWPYHNGASATATSALAMDSSNVYWAGNDGSGSRKLFSLTTAMVLNGSRTITADIVASPSLATVSGTSYLFAGTNGKIYRMPTNLASDINTTQSTSTVYGRVTVYGGTVYFPEDIGKIWALSATDLSTTWSYQDTNVGRHASGCSANSSCTVRNLYLDPATSRSYFGDKDGHVYVLTSAGAVVNANYPYRPGASTDEFQTAPLYRAGVIVIGSTTGKVFVIDQNNGTGPAVYQTFNFQSAISTIAYDTDGYYVIGTADGRLYYLNGVTDPTSGST